MAMDKRRTAIVRDLTIAESVSDGIVCAGSDGRDAWKRELTKRNGEYLSLP